VAVPGRSTPAQRRRRPAVAAPGGSTPAQRRRNMALSAGMTSQRERDRDAARAQTPTSGRAEVRRHRIAHRVEQPSLPLVEGTPSKSLFAAPSSSEPLFAIARLEKVVEVDSGFGEKWVNVAGQPRGRPRYIGGSALTRLAAWLNVHRRQLLQRAEDDAWGRR
jgi:hypothetical protein